MRVISLGGCGAMGRATSRALAEDSTVDEAVIADTNIEAANTLAETLRQADTHGSIPTAEVDVSDRRRLVEVLEGSAVVANALPYAFNLDVMEACLEAGCHYLDLGGLYHRTREQLALDAEFRDAGLTAVVGIGASPGLTNVAAAKAGAQLDRVEEIHIRTGARGGGDGFAYSAKTILDELTMEPVVFRDGEHRRVRPRSGRETYQLPEPVGAVEGFFSIHSELATLPASFPGVERIDFRVAFSPELVDTCEALIRVNLTSEDPVTYKGIETSPREFLDWYLDSQPTPGPVEEWKAFRVDVSGMADGTPTGFRYTTVVASRLDDWGVNATAVWTGVPMALAASIVGRGDALDIGVHPPETTFDAAAFIDTLVTRGIHIDETPITPADSHST